MTEKILSILSPVHLPTVSEWMEIAEYIQNNSEKHYDSGFDIARLIFVNLQSRFEELTRGKYERHNSLRPESDGKMIFQPALLKKEMFVCDDDDIDSYGLVTEAAQSKVWFEGFEISESENKRTSIHWGDKYLELYFGTTNLIVLDNYSITQPTILDFIIELDRYNRTASEKIKINFTENFVKELLQ